MDIGNNHLHLTVNVLAKMDNSQLFLSGAPVDPGRPVEPGEPVEPGGPMEPSSDGGGWLSTAEKAYEKQLTIHTAKPFIH